MITCLGVFVCLALHTSAQVQSKSISKKSQSNTKNTVAQKTTLKKKSNYNNIQPRLSNTMTSTGTYNAYGNSRLGSGQFIIADPTVRMLNERAATGNSLQIEGSGILGVPKIAYGIANGHIIFRTSGAPTFGTWTGSGAVGTGSNPGPIGTNGNAIGVNGKNPYAGPGIYGLPLNDENGTRASEEGARPKGVRRKQ